MEGHSVPGADRTASHWRAQLRETPSTESRLIFGETDYSRLPARSKPSRTATGRRPIGRRPLPVIRAGPWMQRRLLDAPT
jgi:hypothetical protein